MNKDKRNNIQLLGTLNNADESGIIANANQIYDANEDKSTQDVSKEHKERIETLETKENSMQTTLENITKTGEASAASNVSYNHNDSQLNASNVQQAIDEVYSKGNTNRENDKTELEKSISDNKVAVDASIQDVYKKSNYNDGDNIIDFNKVHLVRTSKKYGFVILTESNEVIVAIDSKTLSPVYGVGVPMQVKNYIDNQISKIVDVNNEKGTIETLNEIRDFLVGFTKPDTLKDVLANIYKESNLNDTDGSVVPTNKFSSLKTSSSFGEAKTDTDGNVLQGIKANGDTYAKNVSTDEINDLNKEFTDVHDKVEKHEEKLANTELEGSNNFVEAKIDSDGNVLQGLKEDGTTYLKEIDNEKVNNIEVRKSTKFVKATVDSKGNVLQGLKEDGTTYLKEIDATNILTDDIKKCVNVKGKEIIHNSINGIKSGTLTSITNLYLGYPVRASETSVLWQIKISADNKEGNIYKIVIGTIDQRSWLLPRMTMEKEVDNYSNGILTFDFSNDFIVVRPNEVVFLEISNSNGVSVNTQSSGYVYYTDNILNALKGNSDVLMLIETYPYESIFATKQEIEDNNDKIASLTTSVGNKQDTILKDKVTGTKYKIIVSNGEIKLKGLNYKSMLVIGSSATSGGIDRGLGATVRGNDWLALMDYAMGENVTIHRLKAAGLERTLYQTEDEFEEWWNSTKAYNMAVSFNEGVDILDSYDAVIVQLGENIVSTDTEKIANFFGGILYPFLEKKYPNADFYHVFVKMYGNKTVNVCNALSNSAIKNNVPLIDCSDISLKYHLQRRDYIKDSWGNFNEIMDAAYSSHPSDIGYYEMANRMLNAFGNADGVKNRKYNITKIQTTGGTISSPADFFISEGIVTIRCEADDGYEISNVECVTSDGTKVETTKRVGTMYTSYTFTMPSADVTVTPTWKTNSNNK